VVRGDRAVFFQFAAAAGVALAALALAVSGRWSAVAPFWVSSTTFLAARRLRCDCPHHSVGNLVASLARYINGC